MDIKVDNGAIETLVQEHIKVAVADALKGKSDYLIGRLVDEALKKPDPNDRYGSDKRPMLDKMIDEMIRKAASEAANEWLVEQKPKIKKLVQEHLGKKASGLVAQIAEKLTVQMGKGFDVSVWFKNRDE